MSDDINKIRTALRDLLLDIESMYEGAESREEGVSPEEFFGPFTVWKLDQSRFEPVVSISWPNLAISLRNGKKALGSIDEERP